MDLAHILHRNRKHAIRVCIAKILLSNERRILKIVDRLNRIRVESSLIEALLIEGDVLVTVNDRFLDALDLDLFDLLVGRSKDLLNLAHPSPFQIIGSKHEPILKHVALITMQNTEYGQY